MTDQRPEKPTYNSSQMSGTNMVCTPPPETKEIELHPMGNSATRPSTGSDAYVPKGQLFVGHTFFLGVINIVIDIWMLVGLHHLASTLEQHEQFIFLPPGILVFGYVELAFNICSLALSLCLAVGVNRGYEGERLVFSWVYGIVGLRIYQFLLGVYVLVWLGSHRFNDIVFVVPEIIGISFYWLLDSIVLLAAVICVISYWQELINDLFGKERRVKYFKMLANLRSAAAGGGGAMTPSTRSYYPSRSMSRAASHGSIGGVGGAPPPTF